MFFTFYYKVPRVSSPGPAKLATWKEQAEAVAQVNGCRVRRGIVSAAYIGKKHEWELKWVDPPPPKDRAELLIEDFAFFDAYYRPILDFADRQGKGLEIIGDDLALSRGDDAYIGLHRDVMAAFAERSASALLAFASRREAQTIEPDGGSLFRDGLIIRLGPGWKSEGTNHMTHIKARLL